MSEPNPVADGAPGAQVLLEVRDLGVQFDRVPVLEGVSFEVHAGETLGLVGESGSGKSTLARALLRLVPAAQGSVHWRGTDLLTCGAAELRGLRRELQIVFQDPLASLNPRMTVGEALAEPLRIFEPALGVAARRARVAGMLERVGLSADMAEGYPHEFSGGQCQRVAIARAMMPNPRLLICDEPVSSLDVSIQGQIVNLLADLQREFGTAMIFISHNLAIVRHLCHRVLVLYCGRLVEVASGEALFGAPAHPYTRALLAAVPDLARSDQAPGAQAQAWDDPPTAAGGCSFRARCPHARTDCAAQTPALQQIGPAQAVACLRARELQGPAGTGAGEGL